MPSPLIPIENGQSFHANGSKYKGLIEITVVNYIYRIFLTNESAPSERMLLHTIPFDEVIHSALHRLDNAETITPEDLDFFARSFGFINP